MASADDHRWLDAAARLAGRGAPLSRPNPAVGTLVVRDGRVIARGWTQPGGRPHAEAMALAAAGESARGATLFVTLEPCAHRSDRGPACADLVSQAGLARVVVGCADPDSRTAGAGLAHIRGSGAATELVENEACRESLAGYLSRSVLGRPRITLKLALSIDGCIALANGESQWITGAEARAHCHAERARADAILVGGGTLRADDPALTVRLPGLEHRSPERWLLSRGAAPAGWRALRSPKGVFGTAAQNLFIEGGAGAASAFLAGDLVDRLLIYRAPVLVGAGRAALGDIGLGRLAEAHGRWRLVDRRALGNDTLDVYQRTRSPQG